MLCFVSAAVTAPSIQRGSFTSQKSSRQDITLEDLRPRDTTGINKYQQVTES